MGLRLADGGLRSSSDCSVAGSTIEVLFLEPGYWRMGKEYFDDPAGNRRALQETYSDSKDIRACPDWTREEDSACTELGKG